QNTRDIMKRTLIASMLLLGLAAGCDKKDKDGQAGTTPSAEAAASGAASTKAASAPPKTSGAAATATSHLADSCEIVGRIDVAALLAAPALKDQVVPALEELKSKEPTDDGGKRFKA